MQIKWFEETINDLKSLRKYIADDNPHAANRVAKQIMQSSKQLKSHPALGRPGRVFGTREFVIPSTPYIIAYRVKNNIVIILRVLHAARRWPTTL